MKYEYSCGAILFRPMGDYNTYIIVKDRNNYYSFPKGHKEDGESDLDTAIREIYEEVGIHLQVHNDFRYHIEYQINEDTIKSVTLFLANIYNEPTQINDDEIQEVLELNYREANHIITYKEYRDALYEADKYINNKRNFDY